jgi:cholesterol transport system auxiliary component
MNIVWRRTLAGALAAAVALSACSLGGGKREAAETFDLGPPRAPVAAGPAIPATLLLAEVAAPEWLDGRGIIYRLSYENSARPQAYAGSRWVSAPSALLTQRIRARFAGAATGVVTGSDGARADYALRVDLEDFSQSFTASSASHVTLRARASLVRLADRALVAQRVFVVERAAPTPDSRGAVTALGEASDEFVEQLFTWAGEQVRRK